MYKNNTASFGSRVQMTGGLKSKEKTLKKTGPPPEHSELLLPYFVGNEIATLDGPMVDDPSR